MPAPAAVFSSNCRKRHLGDKSSEKAPSLMRTYNEPERPHDLKVSLEY